ncbi:MAG: hypothetical protein AAF645_28275, partial [Myxococcota bacterium]
NATGFLSEFGGSSRELSFAREAEEQNLMRPALAPGDVCPRLSAGGIVEDRCNFGALASAEASGSALFTAVVSAAGCRDGQLRIARLDTPTEGRLVLRGPSVRSNLYLGVDVGMDDRCTGASRGSGVWGAAFPALSSRADGELSRALGVWLADSAERSQCNDSVVDVEVLEVVEESGFSGGETVHWLTGSNDGEPQTLGQGRGRPAALALREGAYIVAFGDANGDLAIHRLDPIPRPAPVSPDAAADDRRSTDALALTAPVQVIVANAPVFEVALAEGENSVGVVWTEGCQPGRLRFAELDRATLAPRFEHTIDDDAATAPSLAPGTFNRWFVGWASSEGIELVQVGEDGPVPVSSMGADVAPGSHVFLNVGNTTSVTFVESGRREVRRAELTCPETMIDGGM